MPAWQSGQALRGVPLRTVLAIGLAWLTVATPGRAQPQSETDADFDAYCRERHSNSQYRRLDQSWGTEHACVQGGTRQGIDLASACELTTGQPRYRLSGTRVLCEGAPRDPATDLADDLGAPDFARYCRETFPNSAHERRAGQKGPAHFCRRPGATGGFTLQPVDLEQACQLTHGAAGFRKVGTQVICTRSPARPEPSPRRDAPTPPAPPNVPPPAPPSPDPQHGAPLAPPLPFPTPPPGPDATSPPLPPGPVFAPPSTQACQALGGEWHDGTLVLVDRIQSAHDDRVQGRQSGCDSLYGGSEPCRRQVQVEEGVQAYFQILMIWQCHLSLLRDPAGRSGEDLKAATQEACAIEPVLAGIAKGVNASGGFMNPAPHVAMAADAKLEERCDCALETPDFAALVRELRSDHQDRLRRTAGQ